MALDMKLKIDFKKIPKGVRIALAIAPTIVISVFVFILIVSPKSKEIKALKADILKQESEIVKSEAMVAKLDILKVENEKLKRRLKELKEQLPEEKEVSSLLKQISEMAAKSDIDILTWKPEAKKAHPSGIVEEIPFALTLTGTYHNLGDFFSSLTRLNRIVNLSNITLGGARAQGEEAILNINFRASTFSAVKWEDK